MTKRAVIQYSYAYSPRTDTTITIVWFFSSIALVFAATHKHLSTVCTLRTTFTCTHFAHSFLHSLVRSFTHSLASLRSVQFSHTHRTRSRLSRMAFKLHLVCLVSRQSLCDRHTRNSEPSKTVALYIILRALCHWVKLCEIILYPVGLVYFFPFFIDIDDCLFNLQSFTLYHSKKVNIFDVENLNKK